MKLRNSSRLLDTLVGKIGCHPSGVAILSTVFACTMATSAMSAADGDLLIRNVSNGEVTFRVSAKDHVCISEPAPLTAITIPAGTTHKLKVTANCNSLARFNIIPDFDPSKILYFMFKVNSAFLVEHGYRDYVGGFSGTATDNLTNRMTATLVVSHQAPVPNVTVSGRWVQKCTSGRTCKMTTEREYTFDQSFTNSYSRDVETKVEGTVSSSATVTASSSFGVVSGEASATVAASLTSGLTNAVNTARASSENSSEGLKSTFECPMAVPVGKLGYLWQSTVQIGRNTATILHCLDACSASGVPNWQPGDPDHITSCNN